MITKTIPYTDFNGKDRIEDFNFHLNKPELLELEASYEGGWLAHLQRVVNANNNAEIYSTMKDFILRSFGIKSEDGRRFMKSPEIRRGFEESPAFEILLMELTLGPEATKASTDFINGVMPKDMSNPNGVKAIAAIPAAN
jgi:hypothetical protein